MAFGLPTRVEKVETSVDAKVRVAQVVGWEDPAKNDGISRSYAYVREEKEYVVKREIGSGGDSYSWKHVESVIEQVGPRELWGGTRASEDGAVTFWGLMAAMPVGAALMGLVEGATAALVLLAAVPPIGAAQWWMLQTSIRKTSADLGRALREPEAVVTQAVASGPHA
ncbi:hypothetical protein ACLEPN_38950 [Myxococcus sp. 1LA]